MNEKRAPSPDPRACCSHRDGLRCDCPCHTAAPATTGVHVAHCCIKHGCKYGNPNCPVASGELVGDGSCESCADEPATTGARAETVVAGWINVYSDGSFGHLHEHESLALSQVRGKGITIERTVFVTSAPPEVTHGAAIGWRHMDSAPMDGTHILAECEDGVFVIWRAEGEDGYWDDHARPYYAQVIPPHKPLRWMPIPPL